MMIITVGIVLLTTSFAMLPSQDPRDGDLRDAGQRMMSRLIGGEGPGEGERMFDRTALSHYGWTELVQREGVVGVKIMLTYTNGSTDVPYDGGNASSASERYAISEPVNVRFPAGEVRAALLTIWVWP